MTLPNFPRIAAAAISNANHATDPASFIAFRTAFGLLGIVIVARYFAHGWIAPLYIEPAHHLTYLGLAWLQPWPPWGMYAHFAALGLLSAAIAVGYRPRLCAALFSLALTYVELLDRATYLNHHYLIILVSLLLAALPSNPQTVPLWTIWTLRAQLAAVYLFAGIAKLNPDWLLHALPLRIWLYQHGNFPLLGPWLQQPAAAFAMSWSGALFDLLIVPALLYPPTRIPAYATLITFHLATWALFPQLGVFPWLMIALTPIFFPPNWPRRCLPLPLPRPFRLLTPNATKPTPPTPNPTEPTSPPHNAAEPTPPPPIPTTPWRTRAAIIAIALFAAVQIALPLRHYAYPGNVRWTEEGYLFAWRVMLTEKVGFVRFRVLDPDTGRSWQALPESYLTPDQISRMAFQPDLILQTAHIIAADFANRGHPNVAVNADAFVTLNGRPNARLINPNANLAAIPPNLTHKPWILPPPATR